MPTTLIPCIAALSDVYTPSSLPSQTIRWDHLAQEFQRTYGNARKAEFVARAPGRVNCIGEHIDYCGFSVLPAAIERDVLVAFSTEGTTKGLTTIHLANTDLKYTPSSFSVDLRGDGKELRSKLGNQGEHHWSGYFVAGTIGILTHLSTLDTPAEFVEVPENVYILITGSVPPGSGLSSSSAMTTASAIAALSLSGRYSEVARREVTQVAIESERLVGVNSGGMDQAASVFSQPNHLLHIEFHPTLSPTPLPLPDIPSSSSESFSFVIANTLITSDKLTTAKFCYNLRVVETRLGARLLALYLKLGKQESQWTYKSVLEAYFKGKEEVSREEQLEMMLKLFYKALGVDGSEGLEKANEGYTWEEVYELLGEEKEVVMREVVGDSDVEPVGGKLKIMMRGRHVFQEARRVYQFRSLLLSSSAPSTDLLKCMGDLMNDSQTSCQVEFECSCPEIDQVVSIARSNGALGARLTGAGWGGATVSLVPETKVPAFIRAVREQYYNVRFPGLSEMELEDVCFATKPERGAVLVRRS